MFLRRYRQAAANGAALIGLCVFLGGCDGAGRNAEPPADNLLFISLDTTRADRLQPYGYAEQTSPHLAALADRGVVFEHAYSHVPSTLPAHSSMMTGLLPPVHGVRCNGKFKLAGRHHTLAEIAREAGFATGAIAGAFPIAARFGLDQGFDVYDDDFASSAVTARRKRGRMDTAGFWIGHDYLDFERGADEVSDRAIERMRGASQSGKRWFLFAHYFDPHWPYEPAPDFRERFDSPYDAEIAYTDGEVGRLLDAAAKLPGRTLVVLTADHGEGLGEHGERLHNRYLYNSTLNVPLIVALDGVTAAGSRVDTPVGHVDLMPTVLELLGLASPPVELQGRSLVELLGGDKVKATFSPQPVYAETLVWSLERPMGIDVRALVDGRTKFIRTRITPTAEQPMEAVIAELYDLESDPGERVDRSRFESGLVGDLTLELDQRQRRLDELAGAPESLELDEGARERLKSLGYL